MQYRQQLVDTLYDFMTKNEYVDIASKSMLYGHKNGIMQMTDFVSFQSQNALDQADQKTLFLLAYLFSQYTKRIILHNFFSDVEITEYSASLRHTPTTDVLTIFNASRSGHSEYIGTVPQSDLKRLIATNQIYLDDPVPRNDVALRPEQFHWISYEAESSYKQDTICDAMSSYAFIPGLLTFFVVGKEKPPCDAQLHITNGERCFIVGDINFAKVVSFSCRGVDRTNAYESNLPVRVVYADKKTILQQFSANTTPTESQQTYRVYHILSQVLRHPDADHGWISKVVISNTKDRETQFEIDYSQWCFVLHDKLPREIVYHTNIIVNSLVEIMNEIYHYKQAELDQTGVESQFYSRGNVQLYFHLMCEAVCSSRWKEIVHQFMDNLSCMPRVAADCDNGIMKTYWKVRTRHMFNSSTKQKYIDDICEKPRQTAAIRIFDSLAQVEEMINKDIYNFSATELTSAIAMSAIRPKSLETARILKMDLASYINWAIASGYTMQGNVLGLIRPEELISEETTFDGFVYSAQDLYDKLNAVDTLSSDKGNWIFIALTLMLVFDGASPDEIMTAKKSDVNNNVLTINGNAYPLSDVTVDLMKRCHQLKEVDVQLRNICTWQVIQDDRLVPVCVQSSKPLDKTLLSQRIAWKKRALNAMTTYPWLTVTNIEFSGQFYRRYATGDRLGQGLSNATRYRYRLYCTGREQFDGAKTPQTE